MQLSALKKRCVRYVYEPRGDWKAIWSNFIAVHEQFRMCARLNNHLINELIVEIYKNKLLTGIKVVSKLKINI